MMQSQNQNQNQSYRDRALFYLSVVVAFFGITAFLLLYHPTEAQLYGGTYFKREVYLNGQVATTSPSLIKDASVEAATSTMVISLTGANGFDMNIQYFASNTPMTLNWTYEYSEDTAFDCVVTEKKCNWFALLSPVATSSRTDAYFGSAPSYAASTTPVVFQRRISVRNATTSELIAGPRDIFHRWVRVGFKPSEGPTMNLWVQAVIREPSR